MPIMKKMLLFLLLTGALTSTMQAQPGSELPRVFVLGEEEQAYEQLTKDYSQSLLTACNYDMKAAFDKWLGMMQEMETYSEKINFDLKGISVWFHVFWNTDGNIEHIGFLLRPNSRNVPKAEMAAFLTTFMRRYTFPVTSGQKFSHYTGATFPTFSQRIGDD